MGLARSQGGARRKAPARGGKHKSVAVIARSRRAATTAVRAFPWRVVIVPLATCLLALAVAVAAEAAYAPRALPGLTVAGVAVGSLDAAAVRERLEAEVTAPWAAAPVTIRDGERSWTTTNGALGIVPDVDAAVADAIAFGKAGSAFDRVAAWMDALRGDANVPFVMRASGDALGGFVASVAAATDRAPVSGDLRIGGGTLQATRPELGREVDRVGLVARLLGADSLGAREVTVPVRAVYPALDASGFDEAYARASAALTPLAVSVEDRTWNEASTGLATLLVIDRVAARPGELPAVPGEAIAPAMRYRYAVSLAPDRLETWVNALGVLLDHPAKPAKFRVREGDTLAVVPSETGVRVDRAKLRALLADELFQPFAAPLRAVAAPSQLDVPALTTEQALALMPQLSKTS